MSGNALQKLLKALVNTAILSRLFGSVISFASFGGDGIAWPVINSVAFINASCLLHFSFNWINWIASPVSAVQLLLKQQKVFVFGYTCRLGVLSGWNGQSRRSFLSGFSP